jgi:hypothetical protein
MEAEVKIPIFKAKKVLEAAKITAKTMPSSMPRNVSSRIGACIMFPLRKVKTANCHRVGKFVNKKGAE